MPRKKAADTSTIYERPAELLQNLIRFNTTNPPGNEAECVGYIDGLLKGLGVETTLLEKEAGRPSLIARLSGEGKAAPLLLQGHVDVVPTAGQDWSHPPFDAELIDGYIWGRGALDMKSGVTMMLSAFMKAKAEGASLPGDVILCILSDEEAGGRMGAKFLVEEHAELFKDVKYAFGEFGGFTLYMDDKRFYPIMVGEKQICWLKLTMKGPAGHASRPIRGAAMGKMAKIVQTLDQKRLPVHVTPPVRMMIESISMEMPIAKRTLLNQLLNPRLTDRILDLLGDQGKLFDYLLHNTASPTMIHASDKINVIPAEVTLEVDARLLPGLTTADILRELRALVGGEVGIEIMMNDQGPSAPNMGLFDTLAGILKEADPGAIPIPYVLPAVTDARFFAQLGIQTYGFLPMKLPQGFDFSSTVHAADERVPAEAVEFGANAVYQGLLKFI